MQTARTTSSWPPTRVAALEPGELDLWWLPATLGATLDRRARLDEMLRGVLAAHLDMPPDALRFGREPRGRPYLRGERMPDFNLSDTRGGSVIAVAAQGRIGVDLERCDRAPPVHALAARWFSAGEAAALAALPDDAARQAFMALWTAKEAACKATGTGIWGWLAAWRFAVGIEPPRLLGLPSQAEPSARWHFLRITPAPGYTTAIAVDGWLPRLRALRVVAA